MHTLQRHSLLLQERGTNPSFDVILVVSRELFNVHIMLTIVYAYTAPPTRNFLYAIYCNRSRKYPSPPLDKADMQNSYCG